jgi:RNA polymerase sigma-70 factor (ECF subfamily)
MYAQQDLQTALDDEPEIVALVERAVQRDREAFAELYDRMVQPVYRYVYYRTGVQLDAEDLTEQVFMQAWTAIDRFRWQGRPFRAWLYTLAHNALVDQRRRARPMESLDDATRPIELTAAGALSELDQSLDAELLAAAIRRLTPDQQQVITLKFVEGFSTSQVAQLMGKQDGTIRALQLRGLQSLRRFLERHGVDSSR